MDQASMKLWFKKIWSKRPGNLFKKPSTLVLDPFRALITDETKKLGKKKSKTQLAVIPGSLTSQFQSLDITINKPFKELTRNERSKWCKQVTPTSHQQEKLGSQQLVKFVAKQMA
ncbi:pogo transposable element with KRAB domain [Octopus vulgaris]|uniref:Pogo transposable element with KRAB domain n=1 Tax=Octopus vulgaris TaxID=6645 RepID=A0AA36B082_OCTVU|nr:pogo transposable element with KRAB domain [Octopus vulgaris]